MDLITLNKLLNIFKDSFIANLSKYMLHEEIVSLEKLYIVKKLPNGDFLLNRKRLYIFAKESREQGNVDVSIIILKYLLSFKDDDARIWYATNNYQLFKCYLLKNNMSKAYEHFRRGYDIDSKLYPIIIDLFDYILKLDKRYVIEDDAINTLFNDRRFNEIYNNLKDECDRQSHQEQLKIISDKAHNIFQKINSELDTLTTNNKIKEAIMYLDNIKIDHRGDNTTSFIRKMLVIYNNVINNTFNDQIKVLIRNLDLYRSNAVDKIIKDNNLSLAYKGIITNMFSFIYDKFVNSDYRYYLRSEASSKSNIINNRSDLVILDNMSDIDSINLLLATNRKENCLVNIVNGSDDKKVIISNSNKKEKTDLETIKRLYSKYQYKECLTYCLRYICLDPINNYDGYYYASLVYQQLGNKTESKRFQDMYSILINNNSKISDNQVLNDFTFYGIKDIDKILSLYQNHNISLDLACISYGYSAYQINIIKLLIAKYYYSIGDQEKGDLYYEAATDSNYQNEVVKVAIKELEDYKTYQFINFDEARKLINRIEKK